MNILCICERGNSRSVALAWLFKDGLGWEAIAIGMRSIGNEAKTFLYDWADYIILTDKDFASEIPENVKKKLKIWDVGKDRFFRGFEPELLGIFKDYMAKEGWNINRSDM